MDKAFFRSCTESLFAYPDVTVKEIKSLAAAADVQGAGDQRPFLVVLPTKSKIAFILVQLLLIARGKGTTKDLNKVGTPHFAQFVKLEDDQWVSLRLMMAAIETYIAISPKTLERYLTCYLSSPKEPRLHPVESTFRNL